MSTLYRQQSLLLACVLASSTLMSATAQTSRVTDPDAAVPETRYQPAHVVRAPGAPAAATATPDRLWQEHNRIVAGQPGHGAHAGRAGHAGHAGHADHIKPAPDPHAHHHAPAPAQPEHKEHH